MGDAGQPRQQQEGQIVEAGDRFGPDGRFHAGDLRVPAASNRSGAGMTGWLIDPPSAARATRPYASWRTVIAIVSAETACETVHKAFPRKRPGRS